MYMIRIMTVVHKENTSTSSINGVLPVLDCHRGAH